MKKLKPIKKQALFFAPMEGITDEAFRKTILHHCPDWDYLATDFLRVPSAGKYPLRHLKRHFGHELSQIPEVLENTMFQILTSHRAFTMEMVEDLKQLNYPWIDINLGCPSNTVTKNGGGSSLLKDLPSLQILVRNIRSIYPGRLTAKIRTGYDHTRNFEDCVRMLNDEGVEMITVHARTREMMYKEPAQWDYISKAVKISQVPIIGNGDVWHAADISRMLEETGCHGVMVARGALRNPWIAQDYRSNTLPSESAKRERTKLFLQAYRQQLEAEKITERGLLKQTKSVTRFIFEGLEKGEELRKKLLLSQQVDAAYAIINQI